MLGHPGVVVGFQGASSSSNDAGRLWGVVSVMWHVYEGGVLTWGLPTPSPSSMVVLGPLVASCASRGRFPLSIITPLPTLRAEAHSGGSWVDGHGVLVFMVAC